ncbi:hypothetical protein [Christiangramia salexigens]|uniref:Glycine zipper domain-containing protein n=1 Tax=Christiangramia salexigens TaxID=1913577 RepID=A0A1L3J462_9FLAO|nr:hypothetical protein [Christiangramia salexigens]APG59893.1 hypothetical protein LPB144_05460 [Christiangramia salexigens]
MRDLVLAFALLFSLYVTAQERSKYPEVFLRVYDQQGKKIAKGRILTLNANSLELQRKKMNQHIPVSGIGYIKTRHAPGNNVLIGATAGATTLAIAGVASADPDAFIFGYNEGEGAAAGAIVGSIVGAAFGGLTALFKRSKTYQITGKDSQWIRFLEDMGGPDPEKILVLKTQNDN